VKQNTTPESNPEHRKRRTRRRLKTMRERDRGVLGLEFVFFYD